MRDLWNCSLIITSSLEFVEILIGSSLSAKQVGTFPIPSLPIGMVELAGHAIVLKKKKVTGITKKKIIKQKLIKSPLADQ